MVVLHHQLLMNVLQNNRVIVVVQNDHKEKRFLQFVAHAALGVILVTIVDLMDLLVVVLAIVVVVVVGQE